MTDKSSEQDIKSIDVIKDLFAGSLAGIGICLSGHPFDTLKVRISPLSTVPIVNAIVFGSYEFYRKLSGVKDQKDFSFYQGMFAGMFAGFTNSFVVGPIELLKCVLQNQTQYRQYLKQNNMPLPQKFKGPIDVLKYIYSTEGIRGVFKGQLITQIREISCYAAQFATYEGLKKYILLKYNVDQLNHLQSFLLGGIAGINCWLFSYPQDIIKTKLQTDMEGSFKNRKYLIFNDRGLVSCFQSIVNEQGILGLWKGFSACLIRAFYANSIGFLIYEQASQILFKKQEPQF